MVRAYARRRGARDPEAIAAEVMAIAWRRLADVPTDDPRPWLIATARNLLMADHRRGRTERREHELSVPSLAPLVGPDVELNAALEAGLRRLSRPEREALLLVAWEDLTPQQAAASLGISTVAFRARLHRARRRLLSEVTIARHQQRPEGTPAALEGP